MFTVFIHMENENKEPIKFEDITDFEHGQNTNLGDIEAMLGMPIEEANDIMQRYARKTVNPKYYGKIMVPEQNNTAVNPFGYTQPVMTGSIMPGVGSQSNASKKSE